MRRIVDRLREDRRTPLHSWRSQMCGESIRILAIPARILSGPWRFLLQSWLQNATAFANVNAKKFAKNHSKMVPKPSKSIKIAQNGARSKKIAPRSGKEAKKRRAYTKFRTPQGRLPRASKISQNRKKVGLEKRCFFRPPPGTDFASF